MHFKIQSREIWIVLALIVVAISGATLAIAFTTPTDDPGTAGFSSPCARALSKNDDCTFDRATDSLEAISEKVDTKFPQSS